MCCLFANNQTVVHNIGFLYHYRHQFPLVLKKRKLKQFNAVGVFLVYYGK
jgi:hypothetical protein